MNEADVSDKPRHIRRRNFLPVERLTELREEQLESLLAVDESIARLLEELEEAGALGNTLFLFTSDNGNSWGEHRWAAKRVPYEESIRVPLVARWDARNLRRRKVNRLALNVDLASTITKAAGVRVRGREGRSLLPLLRGTPRPWRSRFLVESVFSSYYCGTRSPRWKYVQYGTEEEELYHLTVDPGELRNLATKPQYRAQVMQGRARVRRSACRPPSGYEPLPPCLITGSKRGDTIRGTRWRDWICAGGGRDTVRVSGGGRDVVRCGTGRDTVYADRQDRAHGCERVIRR